MAMTSAAGRSLLAGSLLEEEVSQEERLVCRACFAQPNAVYRDAALVSARCLVSQGCLPGFAQRRDMEAVKAERAYLLEQLAQVKLDPGKAGDDLQQEDIQFLHRELDIKKAKLNELHEVRYWASLLLDLACTKCYACYIDSTRSAWSRAEAATICNNCIRSVEVVI